MALCSDAAMVLYYGIDGDHADHDDWHTYEHMHERLSVPGFVRETRWVATAGAPRYMVIYELTGVAVGISAAYLARLNDPTPWTASMMPRFRGMTRGFCTIAASAGFGLGHAAVSVRFTPRPGCESSLLGRLADDVLPAMASRRGMAGVHVLQPGAPPPMTKEQTLRGADAPTPWVLLATGYDAQALHRAANEHFSAPALEELGIALPVVTGTYALDFTATAQEVARSPANPPLDPAARRLPGVRR